VYQVSAFIRCAHFLDADPGLLRVDFGALVGELVEHRSARVRCASALPKYAAARIMQHHHGAGAHDNRFAGHGDEAARRQRHGIDDHGDRDAERAACWRRML
jgi:hypothetical protein